MGAAFHVRKDSYFNANRRMINVECPFSLTFPSELRMLSTARTFVETLCLAASLDRSDVHAVVVATGEAVSNVIRHAHRELAEAQLTISCRWDADRLEIFLRDQGDPFDLESVPQLNPGELRAGGRGVFLMKKLTDDLRCEPVERGNILHMVKKIRPPSPSSQDG